MFFYKAVVKSGCNVKTTKLLDCALIGACVIIRSITVFVQHLNPGWTFGTSKIDLFLQQCFITYLSMDVVFGFFVLSVALWLLAAGL